jgi:hypothetical protein
MPGVRSAVLVLLAFVTVHVPDAGQSSPAAPRPTYLILMDVDSLDAGEARRACMLVGTFVDRLDPDDRLAIIAVSSVTGVVDTTTNRLAAAGALESVISRSAALGGRLADAVSHADRERVDFRLITATTPLLERPQQDAGRVVVVWITNRADPGAADPGNVLLRLERAAVARRATISTVVLANSHVGTPYRHLAIATGGVVISGVRSADTAAESLLKSTAGAETRRADPAGISELTSLSRAVERRSTGSSYLSLVRRYRTGDADATVQAVMSWTPAQLASEVLPLPSLPDLKAAVALHTEAGMRGGLQVHLGIARRAVEALMSRHLEDAFCRHWVLATVLSSNGTARSADVPDAGADPAIIVARGSSLELPTPADRETQAGFDRVDPPAGDLSRAADLYRAALAMDGGFEEARLRLGRVLGMQHHDEEAIAQLERIRSQTRDARVSYLAALFLAEVHEAAGNDKAAIVAYRAANTSCPDALAARVALAYLLRSSGQIEEADRILRERRPSAPGGSIARDPWQDYLHPVERELSALRQAVRR